MANPMLTTIRRQNRIHAIKQIGCGALQVLKAVMLGAALYLCMIAILGSGSL
ncbi:MAG: hypothetical protein ACR2IJ_08710 [Fluviibacter sp.]